MPHHATQTRSPVTVVLAIVAVALIVTGVLIGTTDRSAAAPGRLPPARAADTGSDAALAAWQASCLAGAENLAGFSNGAIPWDALERVPWSPGSFVRPDAAAAITALNEAFRTEFGTDLILTSSYRTVAQQAEARAALGDLAADPGTSNHGWGTAVDLGGGIELADTREHLWMIRTAPSFGWLQPPWAMPDGGLPEPWHWEFFGLPAPGHGAPVIPPEFQDASGPVEIAPKDWQAICR